MRLGWPFYRVFFLVLLQQPFVFAQSEVLLSARREAMVQAEAAAREGNHQRALQLAESAGRIQMSTSLRMFIAEQQLHLEQYARAFTSANNCLSETTRQPTMTNRETIVNRCDRVRTAARTHITMLVLEAPSPTPQGLQVFVNDEEVPAELFGLPYAVSSGTINVRGVALNYRNFDEQLTGEPNTERTVHIVLRRDRYRAPPPPSPEQPRPAPPIGPIALFTVSGAGAVVAGVFAALYAQGEPGCVRAGMRGENLVCSTPAEAQEAEQMTRNAAIAWGAAATSGVALGLGILWYVRSRPAPQETPALSVHPLLTPQTSGLVVRGLF